MSEVIGERVEYEIGVESELKEWCECVGEGETVLGVGRKWSE